MFPVRRILHPVATIAALAAVAAIAPTAGAATAHPHRCAPGAIKVGTTQTTVCNRHGKRIAVNTDGGTTFAPTAQRSATTPARCTLGDGSVRRGTTVVTITRVVSAATGKTLERRTDAQICADDHAFHSVADPFTALGLIPTSTVIDTTETR